MATIKNYTDLEQSKKLAEILPHESADMHYKVNRHDNESKIFMIPYSELGYYKDDDYHYSVCAWSLSALLDVLPHHLINNKKYAFSMVKGLNKNGETYAIKYAMFNTTFYFHLTDFYNSPIDACVEMILKLHELKML